MADKYHAGEIEVQTRAGVRSMADQLGRGIRPFLQPAVIAFLKAQRLAVVASVDAAEHVWVSLLSGPPGFLTAHDEQTLRIHQLPSPGDPLTVNLEGNPTVGLLVIDPTMRQRVRINGHAERVDGALLVRTEQVYSNCPQYIQRRIPEDAAAAAQQAVVHTRASRWNAAQRAWIERADTFFLGTYHAGTGADASHRGGMPGFVRVLGEDRLVWPDYSGNNMFQSLGNITANPHAGLLFPDFEQGSTLQLSGRAQVIWEEARLKGFPGAHRLVEFAVDDVIETEEAFAHPWSFVGYSSVNPR